MTTALVADLLRASSRLRKRKLTFLTQMRPFVNARVRSQPRPGDGFLRDVLTLSPR